MSDLCNTTIQDGCLTSSFMIKQNKIPERCVNMNRMIGTHVNVICDFFFTALLENKIKNV